MISAPVGHGENTPNDLICGVAIECVTASVTSMSAAALIGAGIAIACSLITSCIQLGGWAVAYALRTEKFYDILGGLNFLAVAAFSAASALAKAQSDCLLL